VTGAILVKNVAVKAVQCGGNIAMADDIGVIVCADDWSSTGLAMRCLSTLTSVLHRQGEVIVVASGDPDQVPVFNAAGVDEVIFAENASLAEARNAGAEVCGANKYAFIDADCVPVPHWARRLSEALDDAPIAGGAAHPDWPGDGRPLRLPQEFDWLVGCGPYHDEKKRIRNTYGCNIAFRANVFDDNGGFDESYGKGAELGQAEEAELCSRIEGDALYVPSAMVWHDVDSSQLLWRSLATRAYEQGAAKADMGVGGVEKGFAMEAIRMMLNPRKTIPVALYAAATAVGYFVGGMRE